jgi:hypothetical protein
LGVLKESPACIFQQLVYFNAGSSFLHTAKSAATNAISLLKVTLQAMGKLAGYRTPPY